MRSMRPLKGFLSFVTPLLGALALLAEQGCTEANKSRFYTYCDVTGCFQCDASGCVAQDGRPPGASCVASTDCAPGCYCGSNRQCAEAGYCDKQADCASGYACNAVRHSCEPDAATTPPKSLSLIHI